MTTKNGTPPTNKPTARTHWSDNEKIVVAEAFLKYKTVGDFQQEVLAKLPGTTLRTAKAYLTFATKDGIIGQNPVLHQDFLRAIRTETAQAILANPPTTQTNPSPASSSSWVDQLDPNPTPPPPSAAAPKTYFAAPGTQVESRPDPFKKSLANPTVNTFTAEDIARELGVPKASASDALVYGWLPWVWLSNKHLTSREVLEGLKDQMSKGLNFKDACDAVSASLHASFSAPVSTVPAGPYIGTYIWSQDGGKPKEATIPEPTPTTPPASSAKAPSPTEDENHYTGLLTGEPSVTPVPANQTEEKITTILEAFADLKEWTRDDVELHIRKYDGKVEVWVSGMGDQDPTSFFPAEDTTAPSLEASLDKLSECLVAEIEARFNSFQKLRSMTRQGK